MFELITYHRQLNLSLPLRKNWSQLHVIKVVFNSFLENLLKYIEVGFFFLLHFFLVETSPPILDINHALFRLRENEVHSKFKSMTTRLRHQFHPHLTNRRLQFPETRLIQYDCGKLQVLHDLIGKLKPDGHRKTGRYFYFVLQLLLSFGNCWS